MTTKKGKILAILAPAIIIMVLIVFSLSFYTVRPNESAIVLQFGKVIDSIEESGPHFKVPFIQSVRKEYLGEQLYDLEKSEVITSDKKTMIADAYVIWRISDPIKFYQTVSTLNVAVSRIDVATYNAVKNHMSSITQEAVISGKDGSLGEDIAERIDGLAAYGMEIPDVEMKAIDLPSSNKDAVHKRMISERQVIAAAYTAEGEQVAKENRNNVDSQTRIIKSEGKTEAERIIAEGEGNYYRIIADAYARDESRKKFYNDLIGLESIKKSLVNGGTYIIDENSPYYKLITMEQ